jgi:hypothetical protein
MEEALTIEERAGEGAIAFSPKDSDGLQLRSGRFELLQ